MWVAEKGNPLTNFWKKCKTYINKDWITNKDNLGLNKLEHKIIFLYFLQVEASIYVHTCVYIFLYTHIYMQLSLELKEKIDDYLKLIGLNPFQHFFCFNESNIIKLGIACSKSSQCNIHCDHRFPSHTYKARMKSYICQIKHRKSLRYPYQMLA